MKYYELTYLISPDLSEEGLKNLSEKINNFIQEETGNPKKTTNPSKKRLAYPIKKKEETFLATLNFYLNPEKLEGLEKRLKSENQILRYIILTKKVTREPELRERSRARWPKKIPGKEALPKKERPPTKITKPKKVELKEIDKKIEEILRNTD